MTESMAAQNESEIQQTASTGQAGDDRSINFGAVISKAALILVFVVFASAHITAIQEEFRLSLLLVLAFETVMIAMIATRRHSRDVDMRPIAIFAGLAGSFIPLGLRPVGGGEDLIIGQAIQIVGTGLQIGAALSLGRSFGVMPANRGIKTGGLFRVVRHPFYFSYVVAQFGYILSNRSWLNLGVLVLGTLFQALRIIYEERLLSRNPDYVAYAATTRWRLMPGVW